MIICGVCGRSFAPSGRRRYCSDSCRQAAYRRRHDPQPPPPPVPAKPATVYECDTCAQRAVGQQRCDDCGTFMRRIGIGGHCPHCDEPVAINDLVPTNP